MRKARHSNLSRVSFVEQSSHVSKSWPNFLCSKIFSAALPNKVVTFSLTTSCRCLSSGEDEFNVAAKAPSKAGMSNSGQRSPKRMTNAWEARKPGSESLLPVMPMSIAGKSGSMKGTKSIFIAWGIVSVSSRKPARMLAFSSIAPATNSGMNSAALTLSICMSTSAIARAAPVCSPSSPARSFSKSQGLVFCRENSGKTCSKMPKHLALSRWTSATGSVNVSSNIGTIEGKYALMNSTSATKREVEPKI
mmetsp:Transcript_34599/g.87489  ORF Transcript_34599/g.87489 Transcript_34599/m.87489 type:complete len:249 (+) Transcript_34599:2552-3298(+)